MKKYPFCSLKKRLLLFLPLYAIASSVLLHNAYSSKKKKVRFSKYNFVYILPVEARSKQSENPYHFATPSLDQTVRVATIRIPPKTVRIPPKVEVPRNFPRGPLPPQNKSAANYTRRAAIAKSIYQPDQYWDSEILEQRQSNSIWRWIKYFFKSLKKSKE